MPQARPAGHRGNSSGLAPAPTPAPHTCPVHTSAPRPTCNLRMEHLWLCTSPHADPHLPAPSPHLPHTWAPHLLCRHKCPTPHLERLLLHTTPAPQHTCPPHLSPTPAPSPHLQVADGAAPALHQRRTAEQRHLYRLHVLCTAIVGVGVVLLQHLGCRLLKLRRGRGEGRGGQGRAGSCSQVQARNCSGLQD